MHQSWLGEQSKARLPVRLVPAGEANETSLLPGAAAKLPAWVLAGWLLLLPAWNFLVNTQTSFLFLFRCCKITG